MILASITPFSTSSSSCSYSSVTIITVKQRRVTRGSSISSSIKLLERTLLPKKKPNFDFSSFARPLRSVLRNCFHVLILGIFVLSPPLINDFSYAFVDSNKLQKYPCEDVGTYYKDVDGLEGVDLLMKLNSIVSPHHSLSYKKVWNALKILDAADMDHPERSPDVVEIYSQRAVSKLLSGKPDGWNREHLWPRSYGLLADRSSLTDLHNIRPADVNVNSARGNKYYGECNIHKSKRCVNPANSEAAPDTQTDTQKWAPPFQVRGDITRAIMYMAVCYDLQLSDSPSIRRHEMGLLSYLLTWNEMDPPSNYEKLRNERICSRYQHNRNPFIDHPEYADLIWRNHLLSPKRNYKYTFPTKGIVK